VVDEHAVRLPALVHDLLVRRTGAATAAQPLLVHRDEAAGTRVELSGTSLTNTVAKASALLEDECGGMLALAIPPHWLGAALALAGWHVGASVWVGNGGDDDPFIAEADVAVVGTERGLTRLEVKGSIYVTRLHPFGLPLGPDAELAWYATDLAPALRAGPDQLGRPASSAAPPVRLVTGPVEEADLITAARDYVASLEPGLVLLSALPFHDLRGLLAVTLIPLLTGGSTVLVTGTTDPERLAEIAATERATTVWTPA
jgi:uncharacterized protein (TIGR03089 family)